MSDIDMRFDGIVLLAALLLGAALYLLIALIALLAAAFNRPAPRAWRVAGAAGAMAFGTLCVFAAVFSYWQDSGTGHTGTDWFDMLVWPWAAVFLAGCWGLTRVR